MTQVDGTCWRCRALPNFAVADATQGGFAGQQIVDGGQDVGIVEVVLSDSRPLPTIDSDGQRGNASVLTRWMNPDDRLAGDASVRHPHRLLPMT